MDPYLQIVKYIFKKNNKSNDDKSIEEFFSNGTSFPQFVAIILGINNIPGIVVPKNKFHISNNNTKTLLYLGQNNPFFKSFGVDFNDKKNIISLINLIICKVYFKVNRTSFIKKCNDFLKSYAMNITSFNEFIQGNGFMKLMNAISRNIPSVINVPQNELIDQLIYYLNSLSIPVVIDENSLIPMNHDILMFQALIIIENAENISQEQSNIISEQTINKSEDIKSIDKKVLFDSNQVSISNENDKSMTQNNIKNNSDSINNDSIITQEQKDMSSEKQIKLNEIKTSSNLSLSSSMIESSDIIILPKSSYLNIVNHIMEINNMKGIIYFNDFEKGVILPRLVEVLSHSKIDNLVDNPEGYDQLMNNMSALYFINQNDPSFNPRKYILSKKDDIIDLIRVLLKKYIFSKEYLNTMKEDCTKILKQYKISLSNFNTDWNDGINFVAMLNFISKGTIPFPPDGNIDISQLKDMFVKANCISIIENDELFAQIDEFTILYQIKIILDDIKKKNLSIPNCEDIKDSLIDNSDKVNSEVTENKEKIELTIKNKTENEKNTKETAKTDNAKIDEKLENEDGNNIQNQQKNPNYIYVSDSCPILRMLNIIGLKIDLHYNSLDEIINGMTLPLLVKHIVGVDNIPGTKMSKVFESMNLNAVFNFLRDKNTVFRYSSFDFNDKSKKSENIIWFITTLLKQFYLKESKIKLLEKASNWIGKKIMINDIKHIFHFGNGFYKMLNNTDESKNYYDEQLLLQCFQKSNVPFILDDDSLTNVNDDYICFQLKLIFDNAKPPSNDGEKHSFDDNSFKEQLFQPNSEQKNKNMPEEENTLIQKKIDEIKPKVHLINQQVKDQQFNDEKNNTNIENTQNRNDELNSNIKKTINLLKPIITNETNMNNTLKEGNLPVNLEEKPKIWNDEDNLPVNHMKTEKDQNSPYTYDNILNNNKKQNNNNNDKEKDNIYEFHSYDYDIPDNFNMQINEKLTNLFKQTFNDILNMKDDNKLQKNYNIQNKQIELYNIFEYCLNSWTFKSDIWSQFISNNKLKDDDILYWILLPPSCTVDSENSNDDFYNLFSTITACKKKEKTNINNVCVEIGFCGSVKEIKNRFGINSICTSNDYIIIVHIRYPSSFNDFEVIENMQSALIAKVDYIVTFYQSKNMKDSMKSEINSLYHTAVSNIYNLNNCKITFLFKETPTQIEESHIKIIHNPLFEVELDKKLNNENIILNKVKNCFSSYIVQLQWININDHETYNHFLETIIEHCQKNTTIQNKVNEFSQVLQVFTDVGSIHNQKEMDNFMYKLSKYKNNLNSLNNSIFKYRGGDDLFINFNQNIWNDFLISNKIVEKNTLYTILFINSDFFEVDLVSKILFNMGKSYISNLKEYQVQIKYCGTVEDFASNFNIKSRISFKSNKSHLAFLNSIPPTYGWRNIDKILYFIFSIGLKCDLIITIPNENKFEEQLTFCEKLMNLLAFHNRKNLNNCPQQIFLFNDYQQNAKNKEKIKSMMEKTPSYIKKFTLDVENESSCSTFLSTVFDSLLSHEKEFSVYNDYFYHINDTKQNLFFIKIFQNLSIDTGKTGNITKLFFSKENIEKTVDKITHDFYSNNDEDDIINKINIDFAKIYEQIIDDTDISSFIIDIKSKTILKVVYNLCKVYIDNFISCDMEPSFLLPRISGYMNDRVTYIDYESIEILKDSCKEEIKDFIYETVKKQCTEQNYYTDSIFFMYENVLERFDKKIDECMKYIDQCYEKIKVQKNEIVVENVKEIEQDSMKYTLSVKESVKEMTIEITCDEDLEREIPTDY